MYVVLVREDYIRNLEIYNRPDKADSAKPGWQAAVLPAYLGLYRGSRAQAIRLASADHGIVPEALLAFPPSQIICSNPKE